jgi:hypothetical protein
MTRAMACAAVLSFFVATLALGQESLALAVQEHDRHPGLGHPEEGDDDHRHGDADDHHETPDSPCHHHDEHTCCNPSPALGLPNASPAFEVRSNDLISIPSLEPNVLPSARELFHVPLA